MVTLNLRTGLTARQRRTIRVRSVSLSVGPKTVTLAGRGLRVKADLRGLPFGIVVVTGRIRLSNGQTIVDNRTFMTCRDGQADRLARGFDA